MARAIVGLGVVLLTGPARAQPGVVDEPPLSPQASGLVIRPVVLEGDRLAAGVVASLGRAQIDRQGEIAFAATVVLGPKARQGLFVWDGGAPRPLAIEGQPVGHKGLLPLDWFGDWAWSERERAVFLAAVDAEGNGRYDPAADPVFLFVASPAGLTPLLRIGDRIDGGTLLAIQSFRLNAAGQVAVQVEIDRDGNGRFDPGIDTAGIYLLSDGRTQPLLQNGDRVGNGRVSGLDSALTWQLNDRGQVVVDAGLAFPNSALPVRPAIYVADPTGISFVVYAGLSTPFGTLDRLGDAALDNAGEIAFTAALQPGLQPPIALFRSQTSPPDRRLELLAGPGITGPTQTFLGDLFPPVAARNGAVGFCGSYDQPPLGVDGEIPYPAACFVLTPEFLYEVVRQGAPTPWGEVGGIDTLILNDRAQAAVQVPVTTFPFAVSGRFDAGEAILFWENGERFAVVGPGDLIPGGRVGPSPSLTGLDDNGALAFEAVVTDELGVARRGVFVAPAPNG